MAIPDDLRCRRSDGKKWRCRAMSMPNKTLCKEHYIQAKRRAPNAAMRASKKKARRKLPSATAPDDAYLEPTGRGEDHDAGRDASVSLTGGGGGEYSGGCSPVKMHKEYASLHFKKKEGKSLATGASPTVPPHSNSPSATRATEMLRTYVQHQHRPETGGEMEDGPRRSPKRRKGPDMSGQSSDACSTSGSELSGSTGSAEVEFGWETVVEIVHFDGYPAFTLEDLLAASTVVLGRDAYGATHWATLDDGNQLAVRRLTRENIAREFEAEVNMLGKIRHPNLLSLRAYYHCLEGDKKFLVFDYMPRGSLSALLHGKLRYVTWIDGLHKPARGPCDPVDWLTRLNIAIGITRGLHHLHTQENIVHGNLNSRTVQLDNHNNAKIAEYGLSKLLRTAANSKWLETAWASEYGAPELSKIKEPSIKTDVYSLGVIILELLTGKFPRKSRKGRNFPESVIRLIKKQLIGKVFDSDLMREAAWMGAQLFDTLTLALRCVDPSSDARPETFEVLLKLVEIKQTFSGDTVDATIPKGGDKPTFGDDSRFVLGRHQWGPKHRKRVDLSNNSYTTGAVSGDEEQKPIGCTKLVSVREMSITFAYFNGHLVFSLEDLLSASTMILEEDIYGTVYLVILEDGNQMMIRRLNRVGPVKEFKTEIDMLVKTRHPNLLALKAYYYCPEGNSKFLVFDYMPRGNLSDNLHVQSPCKCIDWPARLNILIGITRGLHYLHTQKNMVHGNLSSINVLLDDQDNAEIVIYDIFHLTTSITNCSLIDTTRYLAPVLFELKKFNTKSDLYDLGVVMLELLTGKSPRLVINSLDLPAWVSEEVQGSKEVFDPGLMEDSFLMGTKSKELHETLDLALRCVDRLPDARPDVQQVLQHLEEIKQRSIGKDKPIDGDPHADGTRKAAALTAAEMTGVQEHLTVFRSEVKELRTEMFSVKHSMSLLSGFVSEILHNHQNLRHQPMLLTDHKQKAVQFEDKATSLVPADQPESPQEEVPFRDTGVLEGSTTCSDKELAGLVSKDALKEGGPISRPIPSDDISGGCSDNQDSHVSVSTAHPEGSGAASSTTSNMDVEAGMEAKAGENTSTKGMDAASCKVSITWEEIPIEAHLDVPASPSLISSEPDSGYQNYFQALHKLAYCSPPLPSSNLEVQLNRMMMGLHSLGYPLDTWLKAANLVLELAKKREYIEHHIDEYFKAGVEKQLAECASTITPVNEEVSTTQLNISTLEHKQKDLNQNIAKLEEQLSVLKTQREDVVDSLTASRDQLAAAEAKLLSLHVDLERLKQESSVISDLRRELLRDLPSLDEAFDFSFLEILTKKFY